MPNGEICGAAVVTKLAQECEPFGLAALAAAKQWRFLPAKQGTEPVAVTFLLSLRFH
jgi:hypothetical protein